MDENAVDIITNKNIRKVVPTYDKTPISTKDAIGPDSGQIEHMLGQYIKYPEELKQEHIDRLLKKHGLTC